jgi:hypothetical protein
MKLSPSTSSRVLAAERDMFLDHICISAGTPAGTGPVRVGQKIKAGITGFADNDMEFDVQRRKRLFST